MYWLSQDLTSSSPPPGQGILQGQQNTRGPGTTHTLAHYPVAQKMPQGENGPAVSTSPRAVAARCASDTQQHTVTCARAQHVHIPLGPTMPSCAGCAVREHTLQFAPTPTTLPTTGPQRKSSPTTCLCNPLVKKLAANTHTPSTGNTHARLGVGLAARPCDTSGVDGCGLTRDLETQELDRRRRTPTHTSPPTQHTPTSAGLALVHKHTHTTRAGQGKTIC